MKKNKRSKKKNKKKKEKRPHARRMHDRTEQALNTVSPVLVAGTGKRSEMILIISKHQMQW